jgi:hypothetical protein
VHELIAADRHAHVRRTSRDGAEEDQVAGLQFTDRNRVAGCEELRDRPRNAHPVLREYEPDESAAIESAGIVPAVPVGRSP